MMPNAEDAERDAEGAERIGHWPRNGRAGTEATTSGKQKCGGWGSRRIRAWGSESGISDLRWQILAEVAIACGDGGLVPESAHGEEEEGGGGDGTGWRFGAINEGARAWWWPWRSW